VEPRLDIMEDTLQYHEQLKAIMDEYAHLVYTVTKGFPKEELYGVTSQLRRAALSVVLNYVEGYARKRNAVYKNFLEIAYGSLKESRYLLEFSYAESYVGKEEYESAIHLADRIGAMVWGALRGMAEKEQ
jgi:four helix bundle protein